MTQSRMDGVRQKIQQILDKGSFMEIGEAVTARRTDFYAPSDPQASDGVITGYGTVNGQIVYLFAQNGSVMGGTFGEMHGRKMNHLYRLAMRAKAPVIGLLDCRGFRIEEGLDGLHQFAELYRLQSRAGELIPQIMAVIGDCGGGMSIAADMADFLFVEKGRGRLFLHPCGIPESGFSEFKNQKDFTDGEMTFDEISKAVRTLIALLPSSAEVLPGQNPCSDDLNRICPQLEKLQGRELLKEISDEHFFFETRSAAGQDLVTGFIRLNGKAVGAIANQRIKDGGRMTAEGLDKAAAFVSLCDKYHIPILTITDTDGFSAGDSQEVSLPKAAGRMVKALTCAGVPKVSLITGEICGSAYSLMNSKGLGADYVFMWETAQVNIIPPRQAAEILYPGAEADFIRRKAKEYADTHSSGEALVRHGYADKMIRPADSRKYLIGAFETFANLY